MRYSSFKLPQQARPAGIARQLAAALLLGGLSAWACAQSFPSKPIRIVVPFPAGGTVDVLGRMIGAKMTESVGQPVLVDNRPGAGAIIGVDLVAKAAPDGHTMLLIPNALAIIPAMYRKAPFDATKDFSPVTQLVATELVFVASLKVGANSVKDVIALARANPGKLNFGSTGVANPLHLTMELFKTAAGIAIEPIPYKGDAPLNTALMTGEVEFAVLPLAAGQSLIRGGKLRAIAMTSIKRAASMPDVPTIAESGFPGFDAASWQGLFAPAATPRELVQRLSAEAVKALHSPEVTQKLPALGQLPVGSTPEQFDAQFRADINKFAKVVKDARLPPQD
ncbi:MAG: tripartite tricarboxylate transporter substrate binding protein [Betaproteobacteria bacterium]|nr:tripartite tricarboxylate transporter substrate binding protein [Betaproteobacteria bacterium]